jgi:hypothetical protein
MVGVMRVELRDRGGVAAANGAEEILGLPLELAEIRADGEMTIGHDEPPGGVPRVRLRRA